MTPEQAIALLQEHLHRRGCIPGMETPLEAAMQAGIAALRALPSQGWQPIETAPKDGTSVLVVGMNGTKRVYPARWCDAFEEGDVVITAGWYIGSTRLADPDLWHALPFPPQTPESK